MKDWKTTFVGMVLAAGMAVQNLSAAPAWLHTLSTCLVPALTAMLGYLASDGTSTTVSVKKIGVVVALLLITCSLTACKVAGFGLSWTNSPFGSFSIDVSKGALGNAAMTCTNVSTLGFRTNAAPSAQ
jgi:hypothetical protein